jgi:hypothetical protein
VLGALAATHAEVNAMSPADQPCPPVECVELTIGSRRLVGRISAAARAALHSAVESGKVQLGGAGRYGPYWTLTFEGRGAPLVVLADRLLLLGNAGGAAGPLAAPVQQLAG